MLAATTLKIKAARSMDPGEKLQRSDLQMGESLPVGFGHRLRHLAWADLRAHGLS